MGKMGGSSWLNAVKKAFRSPSKEKGSEEHHQDEDEKKRGIKSRWIFRKPLFRETTIQHNNEETDNTTINANANANSETVNHAILARNAACYSTNINEAVEVEKRCTIAAALATAAAAEATQAVMEVIRLTNTRIPISAMRIMREQLHFAAIMIQTAFRGYLARKALKALKGLVKLQALVRGHNVRVRTKMTLQCMQSMVRVQTQLCDQRSRRLSTSSGAGASLKETRNSTLRDHAYNYFPEMGEEISTLEGCSNCKRRLGFPISEELPLENSIFELERTSYDMIKTIRVDNSESHNFSPSPSSKSINRRKSLSKPSHNNYYNYPKPVTPTKSVAHPNYMSDTASAKARIRTQSAPRMRPVTPEREHNLRVAKRRMSGHVQDRYHSDVDDSEFVVDYNQISLPGSSHVRAWLR